MAWQTHAGGQLSGWGAMHGWAVGIPDWLNSEASQVNRYWRVIEEGSEATNWPWKGRQVAGLWGPNAEPRGGLLDTADSPFSVSRRNEKFAPTFRKKDGNMLKAARAALWRFMEGGKGPNMDLLNVTYDVRWSRDKRGRKVRKVVPISNANARDRARKKLYFWFMRHAELTQIPFVQGVIQNDIKARHYYTKGWAVFQPTFQDRQLAAIRDALVFAIGGAQTRSEVYQAARKEFATEPYTSGRERKPSKISRPSKNTARVTNRTARDLMPRGAFLYGAADVMVQALVFDGSGRHQAGTFQGALQEANARLARDLQETIAAQMVGTRPATKKLREATLHEMNRFPRKIYGKD